MNVFLIAFFVLIIAVGYAFVRRNVGVALVGVIIAGILTCIGALSHAVADIASQPAWVNILTLAIVAVIFIGYHLRHTQNSERPLGYAYLIGIVLGFPVMLWQFPQHGAFVDTLNLCGTLVLLGLAINKITNPTIKATTTSTDTGANTGRRIGYGGRRINGQADDTKPTDSK